MKYLYFPITSTTTSSPVLSRHLHAVGGEG